MKLSSLLVGVSSIQTYGSVNKDVKEISDNSKSVRKGSLFVAIKGLRVDAHKFIPDAIKKGANVIVGEINPEKDWLLKATYIKTANSRQALGMIASNWYGNPSDKMKIIGITGTKGKTTTATILHFILKTAGKKAGLISSINAKIGDKNFDTGFHVTSPEPLPLQKLLRRMADEGTEYAVLEVTSHGLDQDRFIGVKFDYAVLTNISHEHLDYHKTLTAYKTAKAKLFESVSVAVLNKNDNAYNFIKNRLNKDTRVISYGLSGDPDISAKKIITNGETIFTVYADGEVINLRTPLLGQFNVLNCLSAIAVARSLNIDWVFIRKGISDMPMIPGRLELIQNNLGLRIYIDFAHTPSSLESVLTYLRKKTKGRLISIFGCAGERDTKKRSMMGQISTRISDVSIFTAEDPRNEDPTEIINQMAKHIDKSNTREIKYTYNNEYVIFSDKNSFIRIPERGEAIAFTFQKLAKKDDCIVVCGKGHEKSMAYNGVEHPWSEHSIIQNLLNADKNLCAVVLAGGKGTRLLSDNPKVLSKIAGRPIIAYTLQTLRNALFGNIIIVVGYKAHDVVDYAGPAVGYVYQEVPMGTGDALAKSLRSIPDHINEFLVLNGDDSAFYKESTISEVVASHKKSDSKMTIVSLKLKDPYGLGRLIRDSDGKLLKIVEEKEASESQKKIKEVNIGMYVFDKKWVVENVGNIERSPSGEYYIVDLAKIALDQNEKVNIFQLGDENEWFGINTLEQLSQADNKMRLYISEKD